MRRLFILCLMVSSISVFSQHANERLVEYLKEADSVLLTHHEDLLIDIWKPGKVPITQRRTLLKNSRPNEEIIKKQVLLSPELREEFINMIKGQKKDKYWDGAYCFEPHHTIFIYKAHQWEAIDLCFGCDHYNFTPNIPVNKEEFLFTYQDWRDLEAFFIKLNLYEKKESKKDPSVK